MNLKYVGIIVAIFVVNSVVGAGNPTIDIKYKKLTIHTADNPYFGTVTSEISSSGETGSAKFSLKKSFSETAQISVTVELAGNRVADFDDLVCELMTNEVFGKDMLTYGLPADKFPKKCPITPGDYEVSKYPLPKDRIPLGTPAGDYVVKMFIGEPDQDPWVTVEAIFEISHIAPKVPAPGFGR